MLPAYTLYKADFIFLSYISPLHRKRHYSTSSWVSFKFFQKVSGFNVFFTLDIYN